MINIIEKDLLSIDVGIIAHQVNCQGVMGKGIALSIRRKYPVVYQQYRKCLKYLALGKIQVIKINDQFYVANLIAQSNYGTTRKHTDYKALTTCLIKLHQTGVKLNLPIYLPYRIGCGNAGGDWNIVSSLISNHVTSAIICRI